MEAILNWIQAHSTAIFMFLGFAGIGKFVDWILKKAVTKEHLAKLREKIVSAFHDLGSFVTLGLAKGNWTGKVWNQVVEPYVIIVLKVIVPAVLEGFVSGLESDNKSLKDD